MKSNALGLIWGQMSSLYGLAVNRLEETRMKTRCWITKDFLAGNRIACISGWPLPMWLNHLKEQPHSGHKLWLLHLQWHNCVCITLSNGWPCHFKVSASPAVNRKSNSWHIAHRAHHFLQHFLKTPCLLFQPCYSAATSSPQAIYQS